ncbi:MAG TPA: lipopolysaccharide transport periplasmic protein LptA [Gallionellaceae bacterium]
MNRPNNLTLLLCALLWISGGAAFAERADRDKPVRVEADQVTLDDVRQVGIFTGDVVMTQGTLTINGDQVEARQGRGGFEHGTVTGKPAGFRQKREGLNEFVEGSGARIEYDAVSGIMNIYGQAHVKRGQDDVRGDHIIYDPRKETFQVTGGQPQQQQPENKKERVIVTINPTPASAVAPADSLPIKPETRLLPPEKK